MEEYPCSPRSGNFCMVLRISESGNADETFFKLDNFPNEDKYLMTYQGKNPIHLNSLNILNAKSIFHNISEKRCSFELACNIL